MGISDMIMVANFLIGFFSGPEKTREYQQCVEAPKIVYPAREPERDWCKDVAAEEWNRVGQPMFEAFEGHRSKNEICKSLTIAQKYAIKR